MNTCQFCNKYNQKASNHPTLQCELCSYCFKNGNHTRAPPHRTKNCNLGYCPKCKSKGIWHQGSGFNPT